MTASDYIEENPLPSRDVMPTGFLSPSPAFELAIASTVRQRLRLGPAVRREAGQPVRLRGAVVSRPASGDGRLRRGPDASPGSGRLLTVGTPAATRRPWPSGACCKRGM